MNKKELLENMKKEDENIMEEGHKHTLFEYCFCTALNELKHKSHEYDTADNFMAAVMEYATAMCQDILRQIEEFQKSDCLYF